MQKFILEFQSGDPFFNKKTPWHNSLDTLKTLAAQGTFSWEGKPLIADFFSKTSFCYTVSKTEKGLLLSGVVENVPLENCRFIAPCNPPWIIFGNLLKVISTPVSFLELQKLPRIIDKQELEELIEDQEGPKVKLLFEGAFQADPTPLLILTDRKGAFANLKMDYGEQQFPFEDPGQGRNRNLEAERYWEKDLLETGYTKKIVDHSHYYCPMDQVGKSLSFLLELGWKIQDRQGNKIIRETERSLKGEEAGDQIQLSGNLSFGTYKADLGKVLGAFNRRDRFIDLGNGNLGLLDENDPLVAIGEEIEFISSSPTLKRYEVGLLEATWDLNFLPKITTNPSSSFHAVLRPYQQEGLNWLNQLYASSLHGILADEMGLGKTVQILAFLSQRGVQERHLIIVPTSLLFNWEKEVERFTPTMPLYRHHGSNRRELPESGIVLTSYHTLLNDLQQFQGVVWDSVILDEAQTVKNPDSQLARAIYTLKSRFRIAMTGTIIENHAKEIYAHFHFLMPGMLGDREIFEKQLSLATVDSRYVKKIRKLISPFILRRKKEEVVKDLPPLEILTTFVEMVPSQREAYDGFLAAKKQGLLKKIKLEGVSKHRMELFEALLRLRQIACSPLLVFPEGNVESGKLEALFLDLISIYEEGKKALIFSQFASMIHLIGNKLREEKIPFCLLEGATIDRQTPVQKFQEDPTIPFFLLTLKAGGVGLNLTAADYVLLYDPWWHDAIDAQAIARAHRIGQTKPVIAKRYITTESIEEKMLTLKRAKTALFSNLLESQEPPLTDEDFEQLLE